MNYRQFIVTIEDLAPGGAGSPHPVAFLDLDTVPYQTGALCLPPVPVVGIGNPTHAIAAKLDTVVTSEHGAQVIAQAAADAPEAAAILAQLLRLLPSLPVDAALTAESLSYATLQASAVHRSWIAGRACSPRALAEGQVPLTRTGDEVVATLDRAHAGNAIDRPMRDALHEAFALVNADPTITRLTLRARGKIFSLGADLEEFGTTTDPARAHAIRCQTLPAREAVHCADRFVAEIDGGCVGAGLELAAFAGRVTATRRSWFQLPELAMGIIPGAGGCVSLSRRIGRQRTAFMVLSGRRISALQALEWGLVDALVDQLP